jgi:hypothetical protein
MCRAWRYPPSTLPAWDSIFLLRATFDPSDAQSLAWLRDLVTRSQIPVCPIIRNHESCDEHSATRTSGGPGPDNSPFLLHP